MGNFLKTKTTFEMDGLFTQEDIDNRFFLMCQCKECNQWSKWDKRLGKWSCECGSLKYDTSGARSIRSWLVTKDQKKTRRKKGDS